MKVFGSVSITLMIAACTTSSAPPASAPMRPAPAPGPSAPAQTFLSCRPPPPAPVAGVPPSCESYTLKGGQSFHDQLRVELATRSSAQMDCPRMRYRGHDAPNCVVKNVGGRVRGACCPPGHDDPTDPECVDEGYLHEMFREGRVWEWCVKGASPSNACEPCVWVNGAER